MADKNKLTEDLKNFQELDAKDHELIEKLNEFMLLLENSEINSENVREIKTKVNNALDKKLGKKELIKEIKEVSLSNMDKLEQLSQLEDLLNTNYLDSKQVKKPKFSGILLKAVKVVIGILFVTLGFAMIILPAPPYFEMFTIFHFTENDGVTLMDLISLIIIASGVYVILRSTFNSRIYE